jgi:alkyl-hydroperoxide reductase/thiol specific antioxidant family protein
VAELRPHVDELRAIGVEPYVIGSGTPAEARDFQRHIHAESVPVLVDQKLASYAAAGWKRSAAATLHPSSWLRGVKAMIQHPQRKTAGDAWQLGGAMIVRPDGEVTWSFRSESGGHHPPIAQLLDEARKAVA